jgi:AraC-like DNA-binding protein
VTAQTSNPALSAEGPDTGVRLRRHISGRESVNLMSALVVLDGHAHLSVDGLELIADERRAVIVAGGTPIACVTAPAAARPYRGYWLELDAKIVAQVVRELDSPGRVRSRRPALDAGRAFAIAVDRALASSVRRLVDALVAGSESFLTSLYLREAVYGFVLAAGPQRLCAAAERELERDPVQAAIKLMGESLDRPLTVAKLAAQVHMSPSALSQRFVRVTGQTPYRYLKRQRLERASQLLRSGVPVIEVAMCVGYASPSHFSCEFKRQFGQTPGSLSRWRDDVHIDGGSRADNKPVEQEMVET